MASAKVSRTYLPWLDGLAGSLSVIALILGGIFVINGEMTLGDLVAFNGYLWMLNNPYAHEWLVDQRCSAIFCSLYQIGKCWRKNRKFLFINKKN